MKTQVLFSFAFLLICSFYFPQIPDAYQKKLFQCQDEIKTNSQAARTKLLTLIDEAEKKQLPLVSIRGYEVFAYHYAVSGNSQNAIKYAQAAIELSDKYDYPAEAAAMYGTIGQQYGQMGMGPRQRISAKRDRPDKKPKE